MPNFYYVIIANKIDNDYPSYVSIWDGEHNIQANIFDAYKFIKKETAKIAKAEVTEKFKNFNFDIIEINKQIFGKEPRFTEEETDVYAVMSICRGNGFPVNVFKTEELAKEWMGRNMKNLYDPYIDAWTVFSNTENVEACQGCKHQKT